MNDTMERQNSTATRSDYFGYDAEDKVCSVYIHFIDIEKDYDD